MRNQLSTKLADFLPISLGIIALFGVALIKKESFGNFDYSDKKSDLSIFLNFYPKIPGKDYGLIDFISKLKLNNNVTFQQTVKINNRFERTVEQPIDSNLPIIIIVPGLGASQIYARWNKSQSSSIKTVDESSNFEKTDEWSCRQVNDTWSKIWYPNITGLANHCWSENTCVYPSQNTIINSEGVKTSVDEFGSLKFETNVYDQLIEALVAVGYRENETLFGANYDFRKIGSLETMESWCASMTGLINRLSSGRKTIIIGHDLGAMIANYFLVNSDPNWKKTFIKSFVSVSGTFGGCPKALRTLLSGCKNDNNIVGKTIRNFSGLSMMLPSPSIYGKNTLVVLNEVPYNSYDIPRLIEMVSQDAKNIYDITQNIKNKCMEAPGVPVFLMAGNSIKTESSYQYNGSLTNQPTINAPFYRMNLPESDHFNYNEDYVGDGTVPRFALEYPLFWSKYQKEPIYYEFFESAEHNKILSMQGPIKYILSVI